MRGLRNGLLITLIMGMVLFFCIKAFADEDYFYGCVKTKLIKVSDIDGDRIVPDIPFRLFSYYAVSEGSCVTYSRNLKNEGKEIIACIAVKIKDKEALKKWAGFIGETFDGVKVTADYVKHYPLTIADTKLTYDEKTNEPIAYLGADKDNPARFCQWCD